MVVSRTDATALTAAGRSALIDELPPHQGIYFSDHRTLAHAERFRDGVCARPALTLLARAGNQVGIDLELVGVQAQKENIVVELEIGHGHFKMHR